MTFHCPICRKGYGAPADDEVSRLRAERCCWTPDCLLCEDAGVVVTGTAEGVTTKTMETCPHCNGATLDQAFARLRHQARVVDAALAVIAARGDEDSVRALRLTLTLPGPIDV